MSVAMVRDAASMLFVFVLLTGAACFPPDPQYIGNPSQPITPCANSTPPQDAALPRLERPLPPFDRRATLNELARAGKAAAAVCPLTGSPHGFGTIGVVFAQDGHPTSATLEDKAGTIVFEILGTPLGRCIEETFCECRVPPFLGQRVTVHKWFEL
jgi:hypothetical protein